jgi:hypothetical protein
MEDAAMPVRPIHHRRDGEDFRFHDRHMALVPASRALAAYRVPAVLENGATSGR